MINISEREQDKGKNIKGEVPAPEWLGHVAAKEQSPRVLKNKN